MEIFRHLQKWYQTSQVQDPLYLLDNPLSNRVKAYCKNFSLRQPQGEGKLDNKVTPAPGLFSWLTSFFRSSATDQTSEWVNVEGGRKE